MFWNGLGVARNEVYIIKKWYIECSNVIDCKEFFIQFLNLKYFFNVVRICLNGYKGAS